MIWKPTKGMNDTKKNVCWQVLKNKTKFKPIKKYYDQPNYL